VPRVLSWSFSTENAIGAEYIIMDAMPGVVLKDVWNGMKVSQHLECIKTLGYMSKELASLKFPHYGSLYLNTDRPQGAISLYDKFCIGPLCVRQHWGYPEPLSVEAHIGSQGPCQYSIVFHVR